MPSLTSKRKAPVQKLYASQVDDFQRRSLQLEGVTFSSELLKLMAFHKTLILNRAKVNKIIGDFDYQRTDYKGSPNDIAFWAAREVSNLARPDYSKKGVIVSTQKKITAMNNLVTWGFSSAIPLIRLYLKHPDHTLRSKAIGAIGQFAKKDPSLVSRGIQIISRCIKDENDSVRSVAEEWLTYLKRHRK